MQHFLSIIILLTCLKSFGQTPSYLHYGVEDGLPSTLVYCMLQDRQGFIWFGTSNGLARFDGAHFKIYGIKDGLPDPEVLELFEDSSGKIWLSCFLKKPCYLKNGHIITGDDDPLLEKMTINSGTYYFHEAPDSTIWIADGHRQICWYRGEGVSSDSCFYLGEEDIKITVKQIVNLNDKVYAVGSSIFEIGDVHEPKLIYELKGFENYGFTPSVFRFKNNLYFSQGSLLIKLSIVGNNVVETVIGLGLHSGDVMLSTQDGKDFWMSYPSSLDGVYKITFGENTTIKDKSNFLKGNQVSSVFIDKENTVWLTTLNNGVYAMRENETVVYSKSNSPIFESDNITALTLKPNGQLIIGDATGNLFFKKKGAWEKVVYQKSILPSYVRQIIPLPDSTWIAAFNNFFYAEKNGLLVKKYRRAIVKENESFAVAPKYIFFENGKTWVGSISGLYYWGENDFDPTCVVSAKRFTAVGLDSENNVWAGGMEGLLSQKDSFQINWGEQFMPISGRVLDIKQSSPGYLWVVTADFGLIKVAVEKGEVKGAEIINDQLEQPIYGIKNIFKSENGFIWLSTNSGVYCLDESLGVRRFDLADGLPNNDVNAVLVQEDTLWAATVAGLAKIQLNTSKHQTGFPAFITSVQYELDEKKVNIDLVNSQQRAVEIPTGASMIDVQLSGLHFSSGGEMTYEYVVEEKLLPIQWLTWGNLFGSLLDKLRSSPDTLILKNSHRNYGPLSPKGVFKITVTALSKEGVASTKTDSIELIILPYWYSTVWISLLVLGIVGLFIGRYVRQRNAVKKFEEITSGLQLQAIKAQINPHFIGNSINAIQQFFYPPDPAKASEYVSVFTSLLRRTMHLSEVPFIPFSEELEFINDYLQMIGLRFGERFEYIILGGEDIPGDVPFPAMFLQPILENATIHGMSLEGVSMLEIKFKLIDSLLMCTIIDNGVGIEVSRDMKKTKQPDRVSKGIKLLDQKMEVLNKMYNLDITISYSDLSYLRAGQHGTHVNIIFSPDKITDKSIFKPNSI